MQLHKLACSSLSLHAVPWACMQFPELSWSSMSLHAVSWACMQFLSSSEQLTRISQCLLCIMMKCKWTKYKTQKYLWSHHFTRSLFLLLTKDVSDLRLRDSGVMFQLQGAFPCDLMHSQFPIEGSLYRQYSQTSVGTPNYKQTAFKWDYSYFWV